MDRVEAAIVEWLTERGFGLSDDASDADRTVKFGVDPRGGWVNVYDETLDIHDDHEESGALAVALASSVDQVAVAASVFDSDLAWLALVDEHGLVAELVHGEEMDDSGQFVATLPPDYDRWASLLIADASADELRRVWTAESADRPDAYISADDRAGDACELLGINGLRATTGFRHLEFLPPHADLRTLHFRIVDEEKVAASLGRSVNADDALPRGLYIGSMDSVDVQAGTAFEIQLQVANLGPEPVEGMLLWAEGPAIEDGHVRLDSAKAVVLSAAGIEQSAAAFEPATDRTAGVGATFDSLHLAGFPTLTTSQRSHAATFQAQTGLRVIGTAIRSGTSSLAFAVFTRADITTAAGSPAECVRVDVTVR